MEHALLELLQLHLSAAAVDSPRRLQALSSARSLLANPDSSASTRCCVIDALVASLNTHAADPALVRPALKILGDAALISRQHGPSVVSAIRPFLEGGDALVADAVAALASVAEADIASSNLEVGDGGEGISHVASVFDCDRVLSLASSPTVAVRTRILDFLVWSAEKGRCGNPIGHRLMILVFLGLAIDLYPVVRTRAVYGMIALLRDAGGDIDTSVVEHFYDCAVVLLKDEEVLVRLAAVKLISECGDIFAANQKEVKHSEQMDTIFVQLCSMARDMCMKVRYEAFIALGRVRLANESVLLQSLSKKILGRKGGKSLADHLTSGTKSSLLSAAGIFVHGIEDEFYEVREAACRSLGMLSTSSVQFAIDSTNLLMDMSNDDTEIVRLQSLQTLYHMATYDRLTMQAKHMQMFLVLLDDISPLIRCMAWKLLQIMKLPDFTTFGETIDSLIINLERFPEEEKDILFVLASVGKNHKKYSAKLAKEFAKEIDLSAGELVLDSHMVAAKLVLFISSSFSNGQRTADIPKALFSYAVPFSGRIACALRGAVDQVSLLTFLSFQGKDVDKLCRSAMPVQHPMFDLTCKENMEFSEILTGTELLQDKGELLEETMQSIKLNLQIVGEAWPLMKSHHVHEVQILLRACREELQTIAGKAEESARAFLDFAELYIQVVELISQMWDKSQPSKSCIIGMTAMDILLENVDMNLRRLWYCFPGLHKEEEYHILELILLTDVFRLSKIGACQEPVLVRLTYIISYLEFLHEGTPNMSTFAKQVKCSCTRGTTAVIPDPRVFQKIVELFHLEKITFIGRFKQKKAEIQVISNDSKNPLTFVPGLPVGIPFHITMYEVLNSDRLWLLMSVGESIQHVFLDLSQFEGCDAVRNNTLFVPFYRTPQAVSFLLKASVGMECPPEDVISQKKRREAPIDNFVLIGAEIDVYFINVNNR